MMTFKIKKRFTTELFSDKTSALYLGGDSFKNETNEGDVSIWHSLIGGMRKPCTEVLC